MSKAMIGSPKRLGEIGEGRLRVKVSDNAEKVQLVGKTPHCGHMASYGKYYHAQEGPTASCS
jgi:hypothetical protein